MASSASLPSGSNDPVIRLRMRTGNQGGPGGTNPSIATPPRPQEEALSSTSIDCDTSSSATSDAGSQQGASARGPEGAPDVYEVLAQTLGAVRQGQNAARREGLAGMPSTPLPPQAACAPELPLVLDPPSSADAACGDLRLPARGRFARPSSLPPCRTRGVLAAGPAYQRNDGAWIVPRFKVGAGRLCVAYSQKQVQALSAAASEWEPRILLRAWLCDTAQTPDAADTIAARPADASAFLPNLSELPDGWLNQQGWGAHLSLQQVLRENKPQGALAMSATEMVVNVPESPTRPGIPTTQADNAPNLGAPRGERTAPAMQRSPRSSGSPRSLDLGNHVSWTRLCGSFVVAISVLTVVMYIIARAAARNAPDFLCGPQGSCGAVKRAL